MALQEEIAFFNSKKQELINTNHGQCVVIYGSAIVDFYDDKLKAYFGAQNDHSLQAGTFLIKECTENADRYVRTNQNKIYFE